MQYSDHFGIFYTKYLKGDRFNDESRPISQIEFDEYTYKNVQKGHKVNCCNGDVWSIIYKIYNNEPLPDDLESVKINMSSIYGISDADSTSEANTKANAEANSEANSETNTETNSEANSKANSEANNSEASTTNYKANKRIMQTQGKTQSVHKTRSIRKARSSVRKSIHF
jgi:hypothetical protein